jgi:hypothetical protein
MTTGTSRRPDLHGGVVTTFAGDDLVTVPALPYDERFDASCSATEVISSEGRSYLVAARCRELGERWVR